MSRLRSYARRLRGWGLLAAAIMVGVGVAAASTMWLSGPAAAAVGSTLAAGLFTVFSNRGSAALDKRILRRESLIAQILSSDVSGRLRRVREFNDPIELGVHPAATLEQNVDGHPEVDRVPPYVPRDTQGQLMAAVKAGGFVVLVGDSTAGKTRAAYEAMRALLPDHVLITPVGRQSIPTIESTVSEQRRCVVWLDDLERFLARGGLTAVSVKNILGYKGNHILILATMRTAEFERYSVREEYTVADTERESWRTARDVLDMARVVEMSRRWSQNELDRAHEFAHDSRIRIALGQTTQFGLAEVLAAGPELVKDWHNAWRPGAHPRGAALVNAAVDCRRAGFHAPVPLTLLSELAEYHLARHGGPVLRPESLDDALAWATTTSHGASSLLLPTSQKDHYVAFDYLIDVSGLDPVPQDVWKTLIERATPFLAATIGMTAAQHGQRNIAVMAFRKADDSVHRKHLSQEFIRTTMDTIESSIRTDPEIALELVQEFSDFASYTLRTSAWFTTLAEELRNIDRYLTIQSARYKERVNVRISIQPEVLAVVVPFLILQPLVENAILHGLLSKPSGGTVTVIAKYDGADAEIMVEDDGVGMVADRLLADLSDSQKGGSIHRVNHRLQSDFGDNYALMVETAPGAGMKVILRVPRFFPGIRFQSPE